LTEILWLNEVAGLAEITGLAVVVGLMEITGLAVTTDLLFVFFLKVPKSCTLFVTFNNLKMCNDTSIVEVNNECGNAIGPSRFLTNTDKSIQISQASQEPALTANVSVGHLRI
jgi:hypothetical protein